MKIYVELMSFIRRPNGIPRTFEQKMDKSMTVEQLLIHLGFTSDEIRMMQSFVSTITDKNNVRVQRSYDLKDGDHLFITLPVGGG
jgi:sulfur carrier protein ThiS